MVVDLETKDIAMPKEQDTEMETCEPNMVPTCVLTIKVHYNLGFVIASIIQKYKNYDVLTK